MTLAAQMSSIERARRLLGRTGVIVALAGLIVGLVMFATGSAEAASYCFRLAIAVLIAMPVRNIVAVLLEELASRDWVFVGLATAALVVLAYAVLDRFA